MIRIAYQGVPGAFSHIAARDLFPGSRTEGKSDFAAVIRAVTQGNADLGILPVENTVIGAVTEAADALAAASGLTVVREATFPIRHCLLALPGSELGRIRWVESHPAALAQCAAWLAAHGLAARAVEDTAGAARSIAADRDYTRAAIAGAEAAERYGLTILAREIADHPDNSTRFVVIASAARAVAAA